jgi:hypothetical protein
MRGRRGPSHPERWGVAAHSGWPEWTITEGDSGPSFCSEKATRNYALRNAAPCQCVVGVIANTFGAVLTFTSKPEPLADDGRLWPMSKFLRGAVWTLCASAVLLPLAAVVVLNTALQTAPSVPKLSDVNPNDVAKAVALARALDPRRTPAGRWTTVVLSEHDVDLLLNQGANRFWGANTRLALQPGVATVQASLPVPRLPLRIYAGHWLNLELRLTETAGLPAVAAVKLGQLQLPVFLGQWLGQQWVERAGLLTQLNLASDMVKKLHFAPQQIAMTYALDTESARRMVASLLPSGEPERLRAYSDLLVKLAAAEPASAELSLARWLGPFFALARDRSTGRDAADAAAENRAALVALTLYANGRHVESLLPTAKSWPKPQLLPLTLSGRPDFPLHLLISAALAVETTGMLSRAVGVWKEVDDSRVGTGFSFNDIAADRAGTRLGEMALSQPRRLQDLLAGGVKESDVMPAWADLPEFLPEAEFKRRFGGVGAPPYLALLAEIDKRVSALTPFR